MNLVSVEKIPIGKRVILRMDTDVPMRGNEILDNRRLKKSLLTIKLLRERECKIVIIGHRGKPKGKDESLSLRPVYAELMALLEQNGHEAMKSVFVDEFEDKEKIKQATEDNDLVFMENVRFWEAEDKEGKFLQILVNWADVFVNDALGVAHRKQPSIMLREKMDTYYGLAFVEELEKLEKIRMNPERPVVLILAGAKKDKLDYVEALKNWADKMLIGGRLVKETIIENEKICKAKLNETGVDIAEESIKKFEEVLRQAKTVVWAGALGKYEEEGGRESTRRISQLIGQNNSFWLIAGGDSAAAIKGLEGEKRAAMIASGGGMVLEFLAKGRLAAVGEQPMTRGEI